MFEELGAVRIGRRPFSLDRLTMNRQRPVLRGIGFFGVFVLGMKDADYAIRNMPFLIGLNLAKTSPRLRMNMDLRNSAEDKSQRMLNAIEPGSPMPIHRHQKTSETVVCLRGRLVWEFYDELERVCTETIELSPNGPVVALNVPMGQWHTVEALESGSVILETKDGAYEPQGPEDILAL